MTTSKRLPWWFWVGGAAAVGAFVYYVWEPSFLYLLGWKKTYHTDGGEIDIGFVDSLRGYER